MIWAFALAVALQTATIDWNGLAPLPYRAPPMLTAEMQAFVRRDATTRKCPVRQAGQGMQELTVDVAVLVDENGGIRVTVPKAIRCPTVEQYAAALTAGFARNNLVPRMGGSDQWYRTSLTFSWKQ